MTEERRSRAPFFVVAALLVFVALGAFVWKRKATEAQCEDLLDHYAELVVREHMPDAGAAEIAAERQRERVEARRDDAFKNCRSEVQSSEHECAMKATSSEALIKCLE
ncbi:MAG: hypothetical protein KIT84_07775 [Labilithrix sp.]|nr:hypothetical protein [Labilithrix sp.]MCW5810895.1 hypothetical protein [Labilithrix sp.]